jgi:predicted deacylase
MNLLPFKAIAYAAPNAGKRLLVLGAVHGNELHGTRGIERVVQEIDAGLLTLTKGSVTFVPITNPKAYALKTRNGDRNLNRNLQPTQTIHEFEDQIANWLCPLMAQHDALLDLHSFQAQGEPFALIGPPNNDGPLEPFAHAKLEEAWVRVLGVRRVVHGWLSTYASGVEVRKPTITDARARLLCDPKYGVGTTEYMRSVGGAAITLECGQHDDPRGSEVAYEAIRNSLAFFGVANLPPAVPTAQIECLHLRSVVDRNELADTFASEWTSFDPLKQGQIIATRASGETLTAPADGRIVFPNPKSTPGTEWFYFAHNDDRL